MHIKTPTPALPYDLPQLAFGATSWKRTTPVKQTSFARFTRQGMGPVYPILSECQRQVLGFKRNTNAA